MIELLKNRLNFDFPGVHDEARCGISFQRTLRIPDDNRPYPLPPSLGQFPVEHVDDYSAKLPSAWREHGGVFLPMHQSEALWIRFLGSYPCAIKIAAGKINAITGEPWRNELSSAPQDYIVIPDQPWLDGFNVAEDFIRQFVAMPLGEGYTVEEQLTGEPVNGGLQIIAYPMQRDFYEEMMRKKSQQRGILCLCMSSSEADLGLAPGGLMRQKIYRDEHGIDAWDQQNGLRCFVHLLNSSQYLAVTGRKPPQKPPTASDYTTSGLPWFNYYSDNKSLAGAERLGKLTSLAAKSIEKGQGPLADNEAIEPLETQIIRQGNAVREGSF